MTLSPITEIIDEVRLGRTVVLVDDEDRENEGDLLFAADFVSADRINFMARHARGLVCVTLTPAQAERLELPPMTHANGSAHHTNFTVAIEAAAGIATGISAADRAHTIRVATRPDARAADIVQPGHVFPIVAQPGGVLARAGHTEAGCDLTRLAGLTPAAVICEVMNDDGTMARLPDLMPFAQRHGLKVGAIADLIRHRAATETLVERLGHRAVTTAAGAFTLVTYRDRACGATHLALVRGVPEPDRETLVRVHEPTSMLDLLLEASGGHAWTVGGALAAIAQAGCGVVVLLNCGEDAATLGQRVQAFVQGAPQPARPTDAGTVLRTYGVGAQILRDLGVGRMTLLARPRRMPSMAGFGLVTLGYREP